MGSSRGGGRLRPSARDLASSPSPRRCRLRLVLALGFRAVSDDDFARVVLAQAWAPRPGSTRRGRAGCLSLLAQRRALPFWARLRAGPSRSPAPSRSPSASLRPRSSTSPPAGSRATAAPRSPARCSPALSLERLPRRGERSPSCRPPPLAVRGGVARHAAGRACAPGRARPPRRVRARARDALPPRALVASPSPRGDGAARCRPPRPGPRRAGEACAAALVAPRRALPWIGVEPRRPRRRAALPRPRRLLPQRDRPGRRRHPAAAPRVPCRDGPRGAGARGPIAIALVAWRARRGAAPGQRGRSPAPSRGLSVARPGAVAAFQIAALSLALVRDGAPTHHPERATLLACSARARRRGSLGARVPGRLGRRAGAPSAARCCVVLALGASSGRTCAVEHFNPRRTRSPSAAPPLSSRLLPRPSSSRSSTCGAPRGARRPGASRGGAPARSIDPRDPPVRSSFEDPARSRAAPPAWAPPTSSGASGRSVIDFAGPPLGDARRLRVWPVPRQAARCAAQPAELQGPRGQGAMSEPAGDLRAPVCVHRRALRHRRGDEGAALRHISAGARIGRACVLGQNVFVAGTAVIGGASGSRTTSVFMMAPWSRTTCSSARPRCSPTSSTRVPRRRPPRVPRPDAHPSRRHRGP